MSSILDALKKLEEEKASQNTQAIGPGEMDLLRAPTQHGGPPKARAMMMPVLATLVTIMFFLVFALIYVLYQGKGEAPRQQIATLPAEAITPPVVSTPPPEKVPASTEATTPPVMTETPVEKPVAAVVPVVIETPPEPLVVAKADPVPAVATPLAETVKSTTGISTEQPVYTRPTPPRPEPITEKPAPKPRQLALPEDLSTLPLMNHADRDRMGLDELRINLLRPPGARRPVGLAILNLDKVYVGDKIPGTTARLVGVLIDGIAVESTTSGAQYFIEH